MSVICGKVYENKIVVAADSIVVRGGYSKEPNQNFSKLEYINDMIIAGTGYCSEQSLMYHFARTHKPLSNTEKDILDFIIEFCKYKKEQTGDFTLQNSYLICYDTKMFAISGMFVREIKDYFAMGAGEDFATAALYLGHSPQEAVKTACDICCFVAEPIVVEEMEK